MEIEFMKMSVQTERAEQAVDITPKVEQAVKESGIRDGLVSVFTEHTSAGLTVTEGLWDLEEDIFSFLRRLIPKNIDFRHNRYLEKDGRLAVNPEAHLMSLVAGYNVSFPVYNGSIVKGSRQSIYFLEFDGPLLRYYNVLIIGSKKKNVAA